MITTPLPGEVLITFPVPLGAADTGAVARNRRASPSDGVFRADAIDGFLKLHSRRGEAIHASVAMFRRYPKLHVFYVDGTNGSSRESGWYSCEQPGSHEVHDRSPLTRGPFASHLDARNAWLRR